MRHPAQRAVEHGGIGGELQQLPYRKPAVQCLEAAQSGYKINTHAHDKSEHRVKGCPEYLILLLNPGIAG